MPIDDIGQTIDIPDYNPNESTNSGSTGATSGTFSNIAGYDITNAPLAPNLILNRSQTSVGIYTPILTPVSNGYQLSWTNNAGLPNPNAVIISNGTNGTNGTDGTNGADGVTYTPHVAEIADGFQITFTNDGNRPNPSPVEIHNGAEGPQGPQGIQGEPGPAGADGSDGEDGFSPVATVTKSGTVITITITDANGTTTQSFDTATGGGVPIDYMEYDWDEEAYTAKEVTGIELYDSGSEIDHPPYAKMHVTYKNGEETNDTDIIIGLPIMFTMATQSGVLSLPITGVYKSGNQFSITLGDDEETIYLNSVPDSGTTGYVLTKTAYGYEWQASQGGGGGGITPTVIIGNQAYPATALQYDPSANAFSVQAEGTWYGYVVPSLKIYEASEMGFMPLKNVQINLDSGIVFMEDTNGTLFSYDLMPTGGSYGQILAKDMNGHPAWVTPGSYVPTGGTAGQMLAKYSSADGAASWVDVAQVPSGGNIGEVLKKYGSTDGAYSWGSISEVPTGGSTGDVLTKTASGFGWAAPVIPQVTDVGMDFANAVSISTYVEDTNFLELSPTTDNNDLLFSLVVHGTNSSNKAQNTSCVFMVSTKFNAIIPLSTVGTYGDGFGQVLTFAPNIASDGTATYSEWVRVAYDSSTKKTRIKVNYVHQSGGIPDAVTIKGYAIPIKRA